jgi:GR25 family glycosyltransferase involved in LPS biosynthesis
VLFNRRPSTQTESNTSMAHPTHFSFAEVVQGRDANVRVSDDGLLYVVDLTIATGKNRDDSVKALRNISDKIFKSMKNPRVFTVVLCLLTISLGFYLHVTRISVASLPSLEVLETEAGLQLIPRQAYVIALTGKIGAEAQASITAALGIQTTVVKADRGWNNAKDMHLFLRYMMDTERYENKLMDTHGQIGCLMSHVHIWENITEPVFVFEEDAVLEAHNNESRNLIANQLFQARLFNWSILMLEARWSPDQRGDITDISSLLATCDACEWFGTRGYIITPQGAEILLRYYRPLLVQVDGLISLVNEYDPQFSMLWVRHKTVGENKGHESSTTQLRPCPRCYSG